VTFKSYKQWGRERKERSLIKDFKNEVAEAAAVSVFIIVNNWEDTTGVESSEVVGGKYFVTEQDAWDALSVIAESYGVDLPPLLTSFTLEGHDPHLEYEEYYIQELTRG